MRLREVERGDSVRSRALIRIISVALGARSGRGPGCLLPQALRRLGSRRVDPAAMRGSSEWSWPSGN